MSQGVRFGIPNDPYAQYYPSAKTRNGTDPDFINPASPQVQPIPRPNPYSEIFTTGGQPFVEGRPHLFHEGVFSTIPHQSYGTMGSDDPSHYMEEDDTNNLHSVSRTSSMNVQPSLSPISSFPELSIGTFHMIAPTMDDYVSSDSSLSSSFKIIVNNPLKKGSKKSGK